jgi:hypothetical protein
VGKKFWKKFGGYVFYVIPLAGGWVCSNRSSSIYVEKVHNIAYGINISSLYVDCKFLFSIFVHRMSKLNYGTNKDYSTKTEERGIYRYRVSY